MNWRRGGGVARYGCMFRLMLHGAGAALVGAVRQAGHRTEADAKIMRASGL